VDGLLLPANLDGRPAPSLLVSDSGEEFALEAVEALQYEIVEATPAELSDLARGRYRLLRRADDFRTIEAHQS
jgi:hypothetical protein